MTQKSYTSVYDGPTIKLIGANNKGLVHSVRFIYSKRSNTALLKFYHYIDSISEHVDTTDKFMKAQKNRINEIYYEEIKSLPIIVQDNDIAD